MPGPAGGPARFRQVGLAARTWDEFFACCRRCPAAGFPALARNPGGSVLAHVAEQLGAGADRIHPIRDAVAFLRDRCFARLAVANGADDTWYLGRAAFDFMHSAQPAQGFEIHALRPFPWGVAPFPCFRRSDPPVAHWTRVMAWEISAGDLTADDWPVVDAAAPGGHERRSADGGELRSAGAGRV